MKIRDATVADIPFIVSANAALAQETEGKVLDLALLQPGVNLGQLVGGLNALGVTPQDLIAVLQAIKAAGALDAELEII